MSIGPVAAFDFDGTISRRDTLVPFLIGLRGRSAFARATVGALSDVRSGSRNDAKAALLRRLVSGLPVMSYRDRADAYGHRLVPRLRPDTIARIREHRNLGHRVLIVSASLEDFLQPVADALGVDAVIATRLMVGDDYRLTGEIDGDNVRGPEKPRRLLAHLGGEPDELWAYGNSGGDAELLAAADHGHWVRPGRRLGPLSR